MYNFPVTLVTSFSVMMTLMADYTQDVSQFPLHILIDTTAKKATVLENVILVKDRTAVVA